MHVHYIPREQVGAYLLELATRFTAMGDQMPTLWVPIGRSGKDLVDLLYSVCSTEIKLGVSVAPARYHRKRNAVTFPLGSPADDVKGRRVLLIDSLVFEGKSMCRVAEELKQHEPAALCSYSLVLKRGAAYIPSFWSLLINDHDRAYLLLERLPNNRLNERFPYLNLRRLAQSDLELPPVTSGVASLDRITWGDRYFNMVADTSTRSTYLLEVGTVVAGYVTIATKDSKTLMVEEVVVDREQQGKGLAGALMRWSDTFARHARCETLQLWGINEKVSMYRHYGFEAVPNRRLRIENEEYQLMSKPILPEQDVPQWQEAEN